MLDKGSKIHVKLALILPNSVWVQGEKGGDSSTKQIKQKQTVSTRVGCFLLHHLTLTNTSHSVREAYNKKQSNLDGSCC